MNSLEMWFVIPAYEAGDKIVRCLDSVMRQKGNWRAIVTVDGNDRETADYALQYKERGVNVVLHAERLYALKNVVIAIKNYVPSEAIVAILDGDDELIGDEVVETMLAPYEDPDVGAAWSQYVEYQNGVQFNHANRTSGPMRDDLTPYRQPWHVSPMRTFRKSIFDQVEEGNFLDKDGEYLRRAYDQALMLPILHLSKKTQFVPVETYIYHNEPSTQTSQLGEQCCTYLRNRRFVGFPMEDVVAGVLTYREGPFLEALLKWLVGMVSKVIVLEDETSMFGDQGSGDETKQVIDRVLAEMPEARSVIDFRVESFGSDKGPIQEAARRSRLALLAGQHGCDWVWHVDADEFYDDNEAKAMWRWFRNRIDGKICVATCSMLTYWRSMRWRVEPPEPHKPVVISRVDIPAGLARQFHPQHQMIEIPPEVCRMRHYSWVRMSSDVKRKVAGWGHAHQMKPHWFEDVFLKWRPGCDMTDLHPTEPTAYQSVVRCTERVPEALKDHPWRDLDIVDEVRIKVVVLHHNMPENADKLFSQLAIAFDDVELLDCGSDPDKIPTRLTLPLENVYWEGAWLEAMARWADYDVIWVIGADIQLQSHPAEYRKAIEDAMPFGCWSPAINGRAHPFMQFQDNQGQRHRVKNVEGMALAVSGELVKAIGGKFAVTTKIGFGQDYWLCAMARKHGLPNYIDGTVKVKHPAAIGYNESEAHDKMDAAFAEKFGADYRCTLFEYDANFQGNLFKEKIEMSEKRQLTIATVENGWGIKEFERITSQFPQCRRIVMRKGVSDFSSETTAEVIEYDEELKEVLAADIVLFTRVGAANRAEFEKVVASGIPIVVNSSFHGDKIEHEKNGFLYGHESWAHGWLKQLVENAEMRQRVSKQSVESKPVPTEVVVSIITPTFRRDPRVVSRCLDCVRLQTLSDVEQLVCSDGTAELPIAALVNSLYDQRITYQNTTAKKPGDFGNVVRHEMLQKARGEYVLFLDDDNLILPHYLERMIGAIKESGKDFAVCQIVHFGPLREDVIGKPPQVVTGLPVKLHYVDPLQIVVKREAMLEIGWDTEKGYLADGHTLQALGEKFEHVEVPEVLGFHM